MTVANVIRTEREKAGLSQRELGKLIRLSYGTIAGWEAGSRKPTEANCRRLAAALQFDPAQLGLDQTPVLHITDPVIIKLVTTFEQLPARAKKNVADMVQMAGEIAREISEQRKPIETGLLATF